METKKQEAAEQVVSESQAVPETDPIAEITGDANTKRMGPAKSGGIWWKNQSTNVLYRIQDGKLMETKSIGESTVVAKKQVKQQTVEEKAPKEKELAKEEVAKEPKAAKKPKAGSRAALLEQAQGRGYKYIGVMLKSELIEILATHDQMTIDGIIKKAKERYLQCSYFQKKVVKE